MSDFHLPHQDATTIGYDEDGVIIQQTTVTGETIAVLIGWPYLRLVIEHLEEIATNRPEDE